MAARDPFRPTSYISGEEIAPDPDEPLIIVKVSEVFATKPNPTAARLDREEIPAVAYFTLSELRAFWRRGKG